MISKRIQHIIDIIPQSNIVADIGTDHGYIPVNLIKNKKAKRVIATDISKLSLQKAKDYTKINKLEDKIDTRLGNGIEILGVDEVDTIIIAGMGGILISQILENSYNDKFVDKKPTLILQPVQQAKEIRYYLYENKFTIKDEYIIEENSKVYHIIIAEKSSKIDENYLKLGEDKDIYMEFGIINIQKKSELLLKVVENKMINIKKLIVYLKEKSVNTGKIDELSKELELIKEIFYEIGGTN